MIYIEYISRRPGVPLADFHRAVISGQQGWADNHRDDHLVWSAGRTWRLGPEPEYVGVWWTPGSGFDRIDYWDGVFRHGEAEGFEDPFQKVARIDVAGCYEALQEPVPASGGTYYAEYFRMTGDPAAVRDLYKNRQRSPGGMQLNLLVHRIGKLGPEPEGLAVWTIPDFSALADLATQLDDIREPVELVTAGTYADIGQEIL